MPHETCPWPGCKAALDRNQIFCAEHHFRIDPKEAQSLLRLAVRASRYRDAETRQYLQDQIRSYAKIAIRNATENTNEKEDISA